MATARDGKMFSSRQAMLSHERKLPPMGGGDGAAKKGDVLKIGGAGGQQGMADAGGMQEQGGDQGMGEESPDAVVAQHGPATEVHIMHDPATGKHHVHSKHADGHETKADKASSDEAYERGKALSSGGAGDDGGMDDAEYE